VNAVAARVAAGGALAAVAAVLAGPAPAAVAGGLLLGLVLPGLAVTEALFRGRTLSAVERAVLAPALSLAVLVVAGLVVYVAGFALDRVAWTVATAGVTLLALIVPAVPLFRRTAQQSAAADAEIAELAAAAELAVAGAAGPAPVLPPLTPISRPPKPPLGSIGRQLIPMLLVLPVLGGAGWLSFTSSRHSYQTTVTALSAAPPGAADASGARTVTVSASGLIAADGPYRITVLGPDGTVTSTRTVTVGAGGTWTAGLSVGPARTTVSLFRAADQRPYRTVILAAAPS